MKRADITTCSTMLHSANRCGVVYCRRSHNMMAGVAIRGENQMLEIDLEYFIAQ
jgi:predicted  nucleic acid-binding Zn-ribbon protein